MKITEIIKLKEKVNLLKEDRKFLYVKAKEEKAQNMKLEKQVNELKEELEEYKKKCQLKNKKDLDESLTNLKNETISNIENEVLG